MEGAIVDHPLWAGATAEEIDHALEVLLKSVIALFCFGWNVGLKILL